MYFNRLNIGLKPVGFYAGGQTADYNMHYLRGIIHLAKI